MDEKEDKQKDKYDDNITLCYSTDKFRRYWICEAYYKSVNEADIKAATLIQTYKNKKNGIDTKLYPFSRLVVQYIKKARYYQQKY